MAKTAFRIKDAVGWAFRKLTIWTSGAEADLAASPVITAGAGAASASDANGSVRLRTNGIPEYRIGSAWKGFAVANQTWDSGTEGIKADTIAESTAAAGVTVDGCLIKDGRAANLATGALFVSAEVTGNGAEQDTAHGFGSIPSAVFISFTELTGDAADIAYGTHTSTNVKATVTTGQKYRIIAIR